MSSGDAPREPERDWVALVATGRCEECGLDATAVDRAGLGPSLVGVAEGWVDLLAGTDPARLRTHPAAGTWSPLEYGAHVRDVISVMADRIAVIAVEDHPTFGWWDHDAAVVEERYNEQDPADVASALSANAARLAGILDGLEPEAWPKAGTRGDGATMSLEGFARFTLHESSHHLRDARVGCEAAG